MINNHLQAQRNTLRNFTERQTTDQRVKEELFRDISRVKCSSQHADDKSEFETCPNHTDVSKGLEQPWSWMHQFASMAQSEKSYNFVECDSVPSDETPTILSDGSFDFDKGKFRKRSELTISSYDDEEREENFKTVESFIGDILKNVAQAIEAGKCDIKNIKTIRTVIEDDFNVMEENVKIISDTLEKADQDATTFENLAHLDEYLKEECKNDLINSISKDKIIDPLSKKFMECNIEIDEHVIAKEVPSDMILGLVDTASIVSTGYKTLDSQKSTNDIPTSPIEGSPVQQRKENLRVVESFINDVMGNVDETVKNIPFSHASTGRDQGQEINCPTFECDIPELPGIGRKCSPQIMENFLAFILSRAKEEKGMVYPRFFKEIKCPVMIDSLN